MPSRERPQRAARRRAVHVEQVADPRVERRDHVGLPLALEAEMADERGVEDLRRSSRGRSRRSCTRLTRVRVEGAADGAVTRDGQPIDRRRWWRSPDWRDTAAMARALGLRRRRRRRRQQRLRRRGPARGGDATRRSCSSRPGPTTARAPSGRWPADLLDGGALVTSHDWGYASGALAGREPIAFPARARDRRLLVAQRLCRRGRLPGRLRRLGGDDRRRPLERRRDPACARTRARAARRCARTARTRSARSIAPASTRRPRSGLPRADDLDDLDGGIGFGIEPVNIDGGVRVNAAFAYLDPARGRPNLTILDRALCDRVVCAGAGWRGRSLRRDGGEVRVAAETVVLAAGAYGSPAILQRSGVGDPDDLRGGRDRSRCSSSPASAATSTTTRSSSSSSPGSERLRALLAESAAARFTPEEQTLGKLRSSRASGPYDLHLFPVAAHPHSLLAGRVMLVVAAMEPRSRGALAVAGAGSRGRRRRSTTATSRIPAATTWPCSRRAVELRARARGDGAAAHADRRRARVDASTARSSGSTPTTTTRSERARWARRPTRSPCATAPGGCAGSTASSSPTAR